MLLVSEELDELLELADRVVVMFNGRFVNETTASTANLTEIGRHTAGHQAIARFDAFAGVWAGPSPKLLPHHSGARGFYFADSCLCQDTNVARQQSFRSAG